uniref:ADP-ribosylation factor-like protein 6 n=1 Tax=Eptatretus burgeri TaxID=7764 RepID=A0A8C4QMF2_EPTBU
MGLLERLAAWLGVRKKQVSVLCVGLDNAGKSTILRHLKSGKADVQEIVPTLGVNSERLTLGSLCLTVFDMSGQNRYRDLWQHYYSSVQAVVFVMDSSDKLRLPVARHELESLLQHPGIYTRRVPLLVFANKSDKPESLSPISCTQMLGLSSLSDSPWHICASNGLTGDGLEAGFMWLHDQLCAMES